MITLRNTGSSIKFTFSGNTMYLNDGEIEAPYNSLTLITDNSGMATFKRIDGDIFISARYEEFGMTKAQLESWFKNNACNAGGGGGSGSGMTPEEVQYMIDESISGKVDTSDYETYTASTQIILSGKANSSDVSLEITQAVSGKANSSDVTQEINQAVSGKVDNSTFTVYTAATDSVLSGKVDNSTLTAYTAATEAVLSGKAESTAVTQEITAAVSGKVDNTTYTAYTAATQSALNSKANNSDVANLFGAVAYDSTSKRINFYHESTTGLVIAYVDATDFIKDGMVQNVEVKNVIIGGQSVTCLVISFNTDSGLEDINIPISEIFNADNYYTKTEVDGIVSGKVSTNTYTAYTAATEAVLSGKAESTAVTQEIAAAVSGKVDNATYTAYTAATEAVISGKAEATAVTAIQDSLSGYVQTSNVTTAVTSGSTDVITSGGVYEQMGGMKLVKITQTDYDNLQDKDSMTLYVIVD